MLGLGLRFRVRERVKAKCLGHWLTWLRERHIMANMAEREERGDKNTSRGGREILF